VNSRDNQSLPTALPGQYVSYVSPTQRPATFPLLLLSNAPSAELIDHVKSSQLGAGTYLRDHVRWAMLSMLARRAEALSAVGSAPHSAAQRGIGATPVLAMLYAGAARPVTQVVAARSSRWATHPFAAKSARLMLALRAAAVCLL